ncbi:MAG: nucleotide exchange factor GrpE [Candidatus Sulfotelmatobacter sp.]
MSKGNGKSEAKNTGLDLEHELPAPSGDGDETSTESQSSTPSSTADAELQKVKAERDSLLDRLARAQAEFENARRRASKEQQDYRDYAITDVVKTFLPVIDSLERALKVSSEGNEFRQGVELIHKQLQAALSKLSVQPIAAEGQPFDPRYHEAIEMVETSEAPDHQVIEELQRGYKFKDRLLRPAMVKVAKNPGK